MTMFVNVSLLKCIRDGDVPFGAGNLNRDSRSNDKRHQYQKRISEVELLYGQSVDTQDRDYRANYRDRPHVPNSRLCDDSRVQCFPGFITPGADHAA